MLANEDMARVESEAGIIATLIHHPDFHTTPSSCCQTISQTKRTAISIRRFALLQEMALNALTHTILSKR